MDKTVPATFTTRSVEVGNYTIGARSNNNTGGRAIILIHGIGTSEKYFRRLADELSSEYNVISINLPGYGETKKPPLSRTLNLDELAGVVAEFIRQEAIVDPIIIGQSMGCQVATRLGKSADLGIDKLILISPTINKKERTAPLQLFRLMQDSLRESFAVNKIIVTDYIKFGFLRYLIMQRYMIADKIEEHVATCPQPTLIIRGGSDKIVPREWTQHLASVSQDGSLVEIKNGPHNLQFTHPVEVANACVDFIEQ